MSTPFNWCKSGRYQSAFSLIELLIVLTIITALFSLAPPYLNRLIERSHFALLQARLLNALYATKAMAVARNQTVLLCGSRDGAHCDGDWNASWLIVTSDAQHVLQVFNGDHYKVDVHFAANFESRQGVPFNAQGGSGKQGRFVLTLNNHHAELILIESGRLRIVN